MVLRLVKNAGPRAPEEAESKGTAAFLLVDGRGRVIEVSGWEALSLEPSPRVIAPPAAGDEPILAGIASAVTAARQGHRPSVRLVEVTLERPHVFVITAAPLPGKEKPARLAVTVAETGPPEAGSAEGKVIRQLGHDLRTPLTSISGAVELLQSGRLGGLQEGQIKVVGLMQKGADALLKIIDEATAAYRGRRDLSELLGVGVEELVAGGLEEGAGADDDLPGDDVDGGTGSRGGPGGLARRKERGR
jgi:signal transduction histidine kinase